MPVDGSSQQVGAVVVVQYFRLFDRLNDRLKAAALQFRYEPLRFDLLMRLLDLTKKKYKKKN